MTAFYRYVATLGLALGFDRIAEWALRKHRERTGKDF